MNTRAILAIVRKDLKVAMQNKGVVLPILIVPLILFVILPWVMVYASSMADLAGSSISNVDELLTRMPDGLLSELSRYTREQQMIVFTLVYMLAPMFLILPLMVSSVLAADSFAGEKERKTLEALLYSPTSDRDLFTAKLLGPWTAAVAVALFSFIIYAVMVNVAGWQSIGQIFFPNWMWIALVFWVTPAVAGLGLVVMVFVSARAQGFQDAYQTGGLVVLPVVALMIGQISGVMYFSLGLMYFSLGLVLLVGLVIWSIDLALLWAASKRFRRGEMMTQF
jgi:ABC-2 type transport system permease protein